ncbi:MAG: hypothetical protein PHF29_03930 [Candidatus Riflebacteria bacterium]|nr:hypothetical protein [Candidatus Riflebacteria bacterium]
MKKYEDNLKCKLAAVASATADIKPLPEGEEIYDIFPKVEIASYFGLWVTLALLVLAVLAYYFLRKKLQKKQVEVKSEPVKECPRKVALREINDLLASSLLANSDYKEVCAVFVRILKTYAHDMYDVGIGYGATSEEFLRDFDDFFITEEVKKSVHKIMRRCDLIMYLGAEAKREEVEALISEVKKLVEADRW